MKTTTLRLAALTLALAGAACSQQSPPAEATVTIDGKAITIKYAAPSLRGRKMFGPDGRISKDPTYPVWRVGANSATALHTDANLNIQGLKVPAGDYTVFAKVDVEPWELIVNKQTKQWGLSYKADQDLGRVKMTMAKPPAPIEVFKIALTAAGAHAGKLQLEWENTIASVSFKLE